MGLFIGTLPIATALRVWHALFYKGIRILFRVAPNVFKLSEQRIKDFNNPMELFATLGEQR